MKAKKQKNGIKVLISLVIALTMVSIPASVFASTGDNGNNDGGAVQATGTLYGETGTPPYDPDSYLRHEDNRFNGSASSDPYWDAGSHQRRLPIPPDVDVTYLNKPDPTVPHATADTDIVATVTNWDDEAHYAKIFLQVYEEVKFDPVTIWNDDMESCCVNWTAVDGDGDGVTWGRTEVRSNSPTHSWHNSRCTEGTYSGNADDWLISDEIPLSHCAGAMSWLNFSMFVQGEMNQFYPGNYEFTDYLRVLVNVSNETGNWSGWQALGIYGDTDGEWAYPEQLDDYTQRLAYASHEDNLGILLPTGPTDQTIRIAFQWKSDPAYNYEGAYIDDVKILTQCGGLQPLVWQEYKPVDEPLYLSPFNVSGFQKEVQFHLPFTPEDDTTYFFEVYSELMDAYDVDDHYDFNGSSEVDAMTGATYWDPDNGVNESVYFGIWHDAQALHTAVQDEVILEDCGDTIPVNIQVKVKNNGTVTEDIPVKAAIREKVIQDIFRDDFEDGTLDKWQGAYFTDDAASGFWWGLSDWDPHTGKYHLFCGDDRGFLDKDMEQGIFSVIDPVNEEGWTPTGDEVRVMLEYWAQWKMEAEGHTPFETGTSIWNVDYDAWAPILEDPVANAGLGTWPSSTLGYKVTGHSNDKYYGPTMPGAYINPNDVPPTGSKYSTSLFAIDMLPTIEHYQPSNNNFRFGWVVRTDESGMPDITYPGDIWSGVKIDDVHIYAEYPGPIVWESEPQIVHLEPGEETTVTFTWDANMYGKFIVDGFTELEGDWNTGTELDNDHAYNETYVYSNGYTDDIEDSYKYDNWATEDNTINTPSDYITIVDNGKSCSALDHYWYIGYEDGTYLGNTDAILQMVNPNSEDGSFDITGADSATLSFDMWVNADDGWDYITIEVSNNSGLDWYILDVPSEDWSYWYPTATWGTLTYELYNTTAGIPFTVYGGYDPILGFLDPVDLSATDLEQLHFRFHFLSDSGWNLEGTYIDDVSLTTSTNETVPYDGTDQPWKWVESTIFFDDMENEDTSAEKWITYDGSPVGDLWHRTSMHNPHSPTTKWWCGDEKNWSSYSKHLVDDILGYGLNGLAYESDPWHYRNNMENNLTLTLDMSGIYYAEFTYWENFTFADINDKGIVYISNDGGTSWREVGGTVGTDSGGWVQKTIDLAQFLPTDELLVRFSFVSNETGTDVGWEIDDILVKQMVDCRAPTTTAILGPATPDGCNGWYTSDVTVTLTAVDDVGMGQTYYNIDGGAWLVYTGPITIGIDGEHTISYYSVDAVGNVEATKSVSFKIDKTAPTGSITSPEAGYIYFFGRQLMPRILDKSKALIIGGLTATAIASDATSGVGYVSFSTSSGGVEDAVSPYEYNLPFYFPFGSDTLTVSVTDNAGNSANAGSVDYVKVL